MNLAPGLPTDGVAPLRVAAFRRFLLANLISATGSAMAPVALAFAVIGQGGGAESLGVVLAASTVPTVVLLLVGGILADRVSRSRMLFFGNLLAGLAQGALVVVVASGHASTTTIACCGFVSGVAVAFTVPAAQGVVPQLVPADQLQQANALIRLPANAVKVLGPVAGGLIVAFAGSAWALAWDAVTFVVAALLLLGLRLAAPAGVGTVVLDLLRGWSGFRARTWLWTYTVAGTVVVAAWLAGYQLLGPVVAAEHYGGARSWGLIQGAFAFGLVTGALVCLRWKPYRLLAVAVLTGAGLLLPLAVMGAGLPLACVLLSAVLAGVGLDITIVAWTTVFQQNVPQNELGRMSAFNSIGERVAIPLGYLAAAQATRVWSAGTVLLACAGVIAATTILNMCVPDVYRMNRRPAPGSVRPEAALNGSAPVSS